MQAMTVLACGAWMGVSSALILVNKHCMSDDGFAFPMALSGLGMAFSGFAATLCCKVRLQSFLSPIQFDLHGSLSLQQQVWCTWLSNDNA